MKKSVYRYSTMGSKFSIDLEVLLDINRELTDKDQETLYLNVEKIVKGLHEESINLNPESKETATKEKADILALFGSRSVYVEEIPNGYCHEYCCKHLPWFIVTTRKGRIKIGWRKRVIHIEWTDTIIPENADILFPDEDVTKYDKIIHAWGYEKALEYINTLLK